MQYYGRTHSLKAKEELLRRGYKEEEVFCEYPIILNGGRRIRVDAVAIRDSRKIALELGGSAFRANSGVLDSYFDKVIGIEDSPLSGKAKLVAAKVRCLHCSYEWTPRKPKPKQCPRCKRYICHGKGGEEYCPKRQGECDEK